MNLHWMPQCSPYDVGFPQEKTLMGGQVTFQVNGDSATVEGDREVPLLYVLRNALGLTGPKFGCGVAQCGACTVLLDGQPVRSCVVPLASVDGRTVTTIEGLGTPEDPHPVQRAFIEEQVPQCGYCVSGWLMYSVALLERNPEASDSEIRQALAGLKCRCATQLSVIQAVKRVRDGQT